VNLWGGWFLADFRNVWTKSYTQTKAIKLWNHNWTKNYASVFAVKQTHALVSVLSKAFERAGALLFALCRMEWHIRKGETQHVGFF
jgi:hypothetical protein